MLMGACLTVAVNAVGSRLMGIVGRIPGLQAVATTFTHQVSTLSRQICIINCIC
jgi:hypothetical protein